MDKAKVIKVEEKEDSYIIYLDPPAVHLDNENRNWIQVFKDDYSAPEVGEEIEYAYYDGWHWMYPEEEK